MNNIQHFDSLGKLTIEPARWSFEFKLFERATAILFSQMFLIRVKATTDIFKNDLIFNNSSITVNSYVEKNKIMVPEFLIVGLSKEIPNGEQIVWYGHAFSDLFSFDPYAGKEQTKTEKVLQEVFTQMLIGLYSRI